jgi:hypothetical protein
MSAAAQIDVSDAIALLNKFDDGRVRDLSAMPQVKIVQIFSKLADGVNGIICEIPAFRKYQVPQSRSNANNLFHGKICQSSAACKVQNSQMLVNSVRGQGKECLIGYELATRKPQFP